SVGLRQRAVWIHDRAGDRQLSGEGVAFWGLFTADGHKVCYRVRPTAGTGQSLSELWMTNLLSGSTERLLPGQMITNFDLSRDDDVVAAVPDAEGKSRLWLAWLDGREPPRRIANIEGDAPRFGTKGEIFFRAADANSHALMRVDENGSAPSKIALVGSF